MCVVKSIDSLLSFEIGSLRVVLKWSMTLSSSIKLVVNSVAGNDCISVICEELELGYMYYMDTYWDDMPKRLKLLGTEKLRPAHTVQVSSTLSPRYCQVGGLVIISKR